MTSHNQALVDINELIETLEQNQKNLERVINYFRRSDRSDDVETRPQEAMTAEHQSNRNQHIIAVSKQTRFALALAEKVARTDTPVVLHGPSGTGKRLFAGKIHQLGRTEKGPFILLSDETSVVTSQELIKVMTIADQGSLYIDKLDELNQAELEVLRQGLTSAAGFRRVRILFATTCSLGSDGPARCPALMSFLDSFPCCYIELAPLAERLDDVEPLATYQISRLGRLMGIGDKVLSPEFIELLKVYSWPGNVRELMNTIEQVLLTTADKKTLFAKDLPNHIRIQTLRKTACNKKGL